MMGCRKQFLCYLFLMMAFPWGALAGEKHFVYFGGGGDPPGDTTIFDESFQLFAESAQQRKWQSTYYFDGGHSQSEEIATDILDAKPASFTSRNYKQQIDSLIREVKAGKITAKDQLMIVLDTHGEEANQTLYHGVLATDGSVTVDELQKLVDLTEKKGIRLAVLDTSCYGGNTLRLAGPNTCVIGLSQPHRMASTEDTEALAETLGQNQFDNLEEAFLHARRISPADSQPQISTPAGGAVMDVLKSLDQALYDYEDLQAQKDALFVCHDTDPSGSMSSLMGKLQELKKVLSLENRKMMDAQDLMHLAKLEKKIQKYTEMRRPLDEFLGDISEKLVCSADQSYCLRTNDIEEQEALLKKELKTSQSEERRQRTQFKLKEIARFKKTSDFLTYQKKRKQVAGQAKNLEKALKEVALEERVLYDRMYKKVRVHFPVSNACRDFKL